MLVRVGVEPKCEEELTTERGNDRQVNKDRLWNVSYKKKFKNNRK